MKNKTKVRILNDIKKEVLARERMGFSSYTCWMVEDIPNITQKEINWYIDTIKEILKFNKELFDNNEFKIKKEKFTIYYGTFAPFDYKNRLIMLDYLIERFSK